MPQPGDTCYMCDAPATSDEHVPPKCVFPEQKDCGRDFRKNLFTVPSCDAHNSDKSHLDVLLMRLAAAGPSNDVGKQHARTKVFRDFKRNHRTFAEMVRGSIPGLIQLPDGSWVEGGTLNFDPDRRRQSLEHLARGLHFHRYREKWMGEVLIGTDHTLYADESGNLAPMNELGPTLRMTEQMFAHFGIPAMGENPEVFFYQAHRDLPRYSVIRATFYGLWQVLFLYGEPQV